MKHCTRGFMSGAYSRYMDSDLHSLQSCYAHCSEAKRLAWSRCLWLMDEYNGYDLRIVGFNSQSFSAGFVGYIDGKRAFFYVTKDYDRYIFVN